jgi:hypothetical protein
LIRYADVILMLSEVSLYLGEEANAIMYLNQVRERAKVADLRGFEIRPNVQSEIPNFEIGYLARASCGVGIRTPPLV